MPNGRPGDHPVTDALRGDPSGFGDAFDALVRELWPIEAARNEVDAIGNDLGSIADPLDHASRVATAVGRLQALKARVDGGGA